MSGWNSKSIRRDPPNEQNFTYMDVEVDNGTVRRKRYRCARCGDQHGEQEATLVVESDRIKTALTTRVGSFYYYASGSAYPEDNRSWPYCRGCYDKLAETFFSHHPRVRPARDESEQYSDAACGCCGKRKPVENLTAYVLKPTKAVHRKGGRGMTAASYPRIRGKAVRGLCGECNSEFTENWAESMGDNR